jgi:hypothetical protein
LFDLNTSVNTDLTRRREGYFRNVSLEEGGKKQKHKGKKSFMDYQCLQERESFGLA